MCPTSEEFFALAEEEDLSATTATHAVAALMSSHSPSGGAPMGCTYSSRSARIGAYNEWIALSFHTPWILHRMGWESEGMLRVYYDPLIVVTDDSGWFFANVRPRI
jgi:hypothetical protein